LVWVKTTYDSILGFKFSHCKQESECKFSEQERDQEYKKVTPITFGECSHCRYRYIKVKEGLCPVNQTQLTRNQKLREPETVVSAAPVSNAISDLRNF